MYLNSSCKLTKIAECEVAISGFETIKMAKDTRFDAIFMDINLGEGIDGIETAQKIRRLDWYSDIPIIAVTAFAAEKDRMEFLSKGCTHYISKPYFMNDIVNLFHNIFNGN